MGKNQIDKFQEIYNRLDLENRSWSSTDDVVFRETLLADVVKNKKIVILGCGDFSLGERLLRYSKTITGVDFSASAIDLARKRNLPDTVDLCVLDLTDKVQLFKTHEVVIDDYVSHCITTSRTQFFSNVKSMMNSESIYVGLSVCWPTDFIWPDSPNFCLDPITHTQTIDGVAYRYFGTPGALEDELILSGFNLLFKKVVFNTYGQPVFFSISKKNS